VGRLAIHSSISDSTQARLLLPSLIPGGKPSRSTVFSGLASCEQCCWLSSPQSVAILSCSLSKSSACALSMAVSEGNNTLSLFGLYCLV
jgi:hypothetical protein